MYVLSSKTYIWGCASNCTTGFSLYGSTVYSASLMQLCNSNNCNTGQFVSQSGYTVTCKAKSLFLNENEGKFLANNFIGIFILNKILNF
jgi:hypothetical protein